MSRGRYICCVVTALFAGFAAASPALAAKKDNSVRFAFDQTLPSPDPYFNFQTIGSIFADAVWDSLIYRDRKSGQFKGNLATAWQWIDEKTLDLDLRQGVTFHNGAAFDADDVVYTLNFVADPRNKATNTGLAGHIGRVVKLDNYKVRIVFKQPFPAAIAYLSAPSSVIHPHAYYAKVGVKGMNEKPIGTGPFRVVEHALGKYIRLERNLAYFKDSPKAGAKIDKVEIRFIADAQTRVAEMVAGGLDLTTRISADQANQLRGVSSLRVVSAESSEYAYLAMNTLPGTVAPALRDIRVRHSIMHAIDRETMAKFLAGQDADVRYAECHPSDFGCSEDGVPRYEYNPVKARQLLAEAGYARGFDIDIYAYRDRNQTEAIIGYLRAVGIRARLRMLQAAAMTSAVRSGRVALRHATWGTFAAADVSATLSRFHTFSLDDVNRDPEVRDLLVQGDSSMDPDVRKRGYAKAIALIAERAYVLPLYSLPNHYLVAKNLMFTPHSDSILRFWEMGYK